MGDAPQHDQLQSPGPEGKQPEPLAGLNRLAQGEAHSYQFLASFGPFEAMETVKHGVPALLLSRLADDMAVPRDRLYQWLGMARTTANRKVKGGELLSQDDSERAWGISCLVGQVQQIVADSGTPEGFDAAQWTAAWLDQPNAALGGRRPGELMDTSHGRAIVAQLVQQMQSAAYA